jgi:hypothetical protein
MVGAGAGQAGLRAVEPPKDSLYVLYAAMIRTAPPQASQVSMSIPNTRFRRSA